MTAQPEVYSSWPNRETWTVHTAISNDEASHTYWSTQARLHDWPELARLIEEEYRVQQFELETNPHNLTVAQRQVLISIGSLWRVDWKRIALTLKGVN